METKAVASSDVVKNADEAKALLEKVKAEQEKKRVEGIPAIVESYTRKILSQVHMLTLQGRNFWSGQIHEAPDVIAALRTKLAELKFTVQPTQFQESLHISW